MATADAAWLTAFRPGGPRNVATGEAQRNPWKKWVLSCPGGAKEASRWRELANPPLPLPGQCDRRFVPRVALRSTRGYIPVAPPGPGDIASNRQRCHI